MKSALDRILELPDAPEEEDPDFVPQPDSDDDSSESVLEHKSDDLKLLEEHEAKRLFGELREQTKPSAVPLYTVPTFSKLPVLSATSKKSGWELGLSKLGDGTHVSITQCQATSRVTETLPPTVPGSLILKEIEDAEKNILTTETVRFAGRTFLIQVDAQGKAKTTTTPASQFDQVAASIQDALKDNRQVSTVEKSRSDWQQNLQTAGEDLALARRRQQEADYLSKKRFREQSEFVSLKRQRR